MLFTLNGSMVYITEEHDNCLQMKDFRTVSQSDFSREKPLLPPYYLIEVLLWGLIETWTTIRKIDEIK